MTSTTQRNAEALAQRNGTTLPKPTPAPKAVAKGNEAVAKGNDPKVVAPSNEAPAIPTLACGCGCGNQAKPGRRYLPGHDARHAGQVGRLLASPATEEAGKRELAKLAPALQTKATRFAENRRKEAAKKEAAARIREAAKKALEAELAAL